MIGYIYLLQEREFIKTKENIYKLGKTKQENLKRIQNYPNGTKLIIQLQCKNCDINNKASVIIQISPLLGELLTINLAQNLPKT